MAKYWLMMFLCSWGVMAAESMPDPTMPLKATASATATTPAATTGLPQLQSIVFSRTHRRAMLDHAVYQEGMTVKGFKIRQIQADRVILEGADGRHTLRLFTTQVRFK